MVNDGWAGWPKALGELPLASFGWEGYHFQEDGFPHATQWGSKSSHTEMTVVNNKLHLCPPPGNVSKSCFLSGHVLPIRPLIHDMVMWLSLLPVMGQPMGSQKFKPMWAFSMLPAGTELTKWKYIQFSFMRHNSNSRKSSETCGFPLPLHEKQLQRNTVSYTGNDCPRTCMWGRAVIMAATVTGTS